MIEKEVTVTNPKGLHARPSALLVKTAQSFESEIILYNGDTSADAKSVLSVMTLCADYGTTLKLTVSGSDEEIAAEKIVEVFSVRYSYDE
jgi:phosphocarrier protein